MSETASPPPSNPHANIIDFLRRLAGIMGSGGNATLLEQAAVVIEQLAERASVAEQAWRDEAEGHTRAIALRGTAERAYDTLRARSVELQAELAESNRLADSERNFFAEEARRLQGLADDAEARLTAAQAELGELRATGRPSEDQRSEVEGPQVELAALKTELDERSRLSDIERTAHAEETQRLRSLAEDAEKRLDAANAERDAQREAAGASEALRAELTTLNAKLDETSRFAESERNVFAEETRRLRGLADDAEARLTATTAELGELRGTVERASQDLRDKVAALQAKLEESDRLADTERAAHAEEARRLRGITDAAEARLKAANIELDELRGSMTAIDQSIAVVPVNSLELARTQFTFLAEDFARNGDVISQTICEIGACAIDKALTGSLPPESAVSPLVKELLS
jgi:chromosome segregation ATPase